MVLDNDMFLGKLQALFSKFIGDVTNLFSGRFNQDPLTPPHVPGTESVNFDTIVPDEGEIIDSQKWMWGIDKTGSIYQRELDSHGTWLMTMRRLPIGAAAKLVYYEHQLYALNTVRDWWVWFDNKWVQTSAPGEPVIGPAKPVIPVEKKANDAPKGA